MGKKKTAKPNAYFSFMQAMRPLVEKRLGRTVPFEDMNNHVGPEWKKMSPEEKAKFAPNKRHIPLDCNGVPLSVHAELAELKRKTKEDMIMGTVNLIDLHVTGNMMTELEVVVVAVTDYIITEEEQVIPAEVSLVRLTLGGGLTPVQYHCIINPPSSWPLGYAAAVIDRVAATHRLPTNRRSPDCVGTDSLHKVAAAMTPFLTQGENSGRLCPIFTLEERLDMTRKVFRQSFGMDAVPVWSLENLLRGVYGALYPQHAGLYTNSHARDELVNSAQSPEYHPALGCKWHREERPDEVNHCSLNMAQRWGYMLLHALNVDESLGVQLVAGRHWPGPNPNKGQVIHLSAQHKKRNIRHHLTSMQTINTASECCSDTDTDTASVASSTVPWKPFHLKTWQEIERGPKTPVLQNSVEFPSLGGGRSLGPEGSTRERKARPSNGDAGHLPNRNAGGGGGKGASIRSAAICLLAKSKESVEEGAGCSTVLEEQLRRVNLNGTGSNVQCTKHDGVGRTQQLRPAAAGPVRPGLSFSGIGRGRKI